MRAIDLIVVAVLLTGVFQEALAERGFCFPGECGFMDHRELVLASYAEVNPAVDGVIVGRIEAVHTRYGSDEVGAEEARVVGVDVVVEESLAGCFETGERKEVVVFGYGGWHWDDRSAEAMAPVLAIVEANFDLERELAEQDSLAFFEQEVPARLERNRRRLFALGMERKLPFLVISIHLGGLDDPRRRTEAVVVPGKPYLMFIPDMGIFPFESRSGRSELPFDIYPASFASLVPETNRPETCESAQERAGRAFAW